MFTFGLRIRNDTSASLDESAAGRRPERTDNNVEAEVAVRADPTNGARIKTTGDGFEFGDNLHRSHFGCARDGATREQGPDDVRGTDPSGQAAFDL